MTFSGGFPRSWPGLNRAQSLAATSPARDAVRELLASTVLGGLSMGAGVIGSLWPGRPAAARV
jgi:hypothetical protein